MLQKTKAGYDILKGGTCICLTAFGQEVENIRFIYPLVEYILEIHRYFTVHTLSAYRPEWWQLKLCATKKPEKTFYA